MTANTAVDFIGVADLLACPECHGQLTVAMSRWICVRCAHTYEIVDGILDFLGNRVVRQNPFYNDPAYRRLNRAAAAIHREHYRDGSVSGWAERSIKSDVTKLVKTNHRLVVDLGCGTGTGFHLVTESTVLVGVDENLDLLRIAGRQRPNAILIRADLQRLPFATGSVPAVMALAVLEHTFFLQATLAELKRVQSTDGYTYVLIPSEGSLGCALVRRFVTGPRNAALCGITADEFINAMKIEHCNSAKTIESEIHNYFVIEQRIAWPFRAGGRALNLALTYRLRPRR